MSTIGADEKISSLKVLLKDSDDPDYCVTLYQHGRYQGYTDVVCYGEDVADVGATFGHDDSYSSIKVGSKVKAELYADVNYSNLLLSTESDVYRFGPIGINDQVSSVKIKVKWGAWSIKNNIFKTKRSLVLKKIYIYLHIYNNENYN